MKIESEHLLGLPREYANDDNECMFKVKNLCCGCWRQCTLTHVERKVRGTFRFFFIHSFLSLFFSSFFVRSYTRWDILLKGFCSFSLFWRNMTMRWFNNQHLVFLIVSFDQYICYIISFTYSFESN